MSCGKKNISTQADKINYPENPLRSHDMMYAENFRLTYFKDYKVIEVDTGDIQKYYLSHDTEILERLKLSENKNSQKTQVSQFYVKQPVNKIISLSSQNLTYLSILGKTDRLAGIDSASNINNSQIVKLVQEGRIKQLGEGRNIDTETLTVVNPDVIFASWTGGVYDSAEMLAGKGFTVAAAAEWLEKHPLARAEWLVFAAAFFDMEEEAYKIFRETEANYLKLQKSALQVTEKPAVFANMPYSGSWGVPGGKSYMARFIKDAGGEYIWADTEREGTLFFDFETVLSKAGNAQIWLINSSGMNSRKEIADWDSRYERFKAFREDGVYNNNLLENSFGNPYWEEGSVYPDRILSDLIKIFHPGLAPSDNEFYYFKKIP